MTHQEEKMTYEYLKKYGTKIGKIIITKKEPTKVDIILDYKKAIENVNVVTLYGIKITHDVGPYFIATIDEGTLSIYDYIYYKETLEDNLKKVKIYIPIW